MSDAALKITALGGLHEIGKNLYLLESIDKADKSEFILLDAGIIYPGYEYPGVDFVLPDTKSLKDKQIDALVLTSVHEGHSGGAHHMIKNYNIPKVIGSKLAIEQVKARLEDELISKVEWQDFTTREAQQIGSFTISPFKITSSSAESYAVGIEAQKTKLFYTGTYKIDQTPSDGVTTDLAGITQYTINGAKEEPSVDLLLANSAGVEGEGYTMSELDVIPKLRSICTSYQSRVIINTYSSNTVRIRNIFNLADECNRKIALLGKEVKESYQAAIASGYLSHPKDLIVSIRDIDKLQDQEVLVLCSAPEGDAIREIEALAYDRNLELQLKEGDVLVNSADLPPGTVRVMAQISDQCFLKNVTIIGGPKSGTHAQTHAMTEEMKYLYNLIRPKFSIPAFGETRQLVRHAKLATETGFDPSAIFILDNGDTVKMSNHGEFDIEVSGSIETGDINFNHKQDFHVDDKIIKERESLSQDGVVMVSFSLNKKKKVVSGPVFSARACTFSGNKEWKAFCLVNTPDLVDALDQVTADDPGAELEDYQKTTRDFMSKIIRQQIGKKPSVIVFANEV